MRLRRSALGLLLLVLAACEAGTVSPSLSEPPASPSGSVAPTVSAGTAAPSDLVIPPSPGTSPFPPATVEPSAAPIGTANIPFANRAMEVAIVGQPGIVVAWRGATDHELGALAWDADADIAVGRLTDRELVLGLIGTVCDIEATLTVMPGALIVSPVPRQGCDAMAVGRGLVLTFAAPVDPASVEVGLVDTVLLPEST